MTPSFSTPLLLLLPFLFVFLVSSVNSASDNIAASTARRLLHQPLYPIQWTPSPPAGDPSSLFFPSVPAATATPNPGTNATVATYFSSSRPGSGKNPVVVVAAAAASVAFLALLILSGFLLYRRHRSARDLMDSRKPFAGGDDANGGRAVASADFLYPGAVELSSDPWRPRTEDAVGSSPCWKLGTETLLEMDHQPNPELQPLPRLTRPLSGRVVPQPPPQRSSSVISRASSDDDPTFYPPKRSVALVTNESPSNPVPSMSSETKESFPAAAMATGTAPTQQPPPRHPRSRRTFPRMQLADCPNSTRRQPPRPPATLPTPLPLAPTAYTFSRMRPPAPPLPQATLDAAWRREQPMNVSTEPAPLGPTSRHGIAETSSTARSEWFS